MRLQWFGRAKSAPQVETKARPTGRVAALASGGGRVVWSARDHASLTQAGFIGNPVGFRSVRLIAERRTEIVAMSNGYEERNAPWAHSRRRYDAGLGLRSLDDVAALIAFFEARAGQLHGFRWKDWADYKSCAPSAAPGFADQEIGQGDSRRTVFALSKRYASGPASYLRPIVKPVRGTVRVGVGGDERREGLDYALDSTTGEIRFAEPPGAGAAVTAGFEFDVPVRFDTDRIAVSVASFQAGDLPQIPVVEVRL